MLDKRLSVEAKNVKGYLAGAVALGVVGALLAVAQAWLISQVIARVFLADAGMAQVRHLLEFALGVMVLRGILQIFGDISSREAAIRVKEGMRQRLLARLLERGPVYCRGERGGELVNTVNEGIEALDEYFSRFLPQLGLAVFIPLLILGFVAPLDIQSGLILLVTGPLIPFFMILIGKLAEKKSQKQWQSLSRMSAHFLDMLQGLSTLKVFGRSRDQIRVIARVSESFRESTMGVLRIAFLSALVLEFMATISTALVAVALGLRLIEGTIGYGESLFLLMLAPDYYGPLRALGTSFHARMSGVNAAERITEVMTGPEGLAREEAAGVASGEVKSDARVISDPIKEETTFGHRAVRDQERDCSHAEQSIMKGPAPTSSGIPIVFDNVSLSYDQDEQKALQGISFSIESGQRVALVGPSGAGKTSILQIILGFIEPTAGEVRSNGVSLQDIPKEIWWENIAYVPQQTYLFAGSVWDNLLLGRAAASREEVTRAAQWAGAHEFIMSLPQGYETRLGEGGARISGGEAQRLALARAFLKDAPLVLFDEAMSGLDVRNEQRIQEAMSRHLQGKTLISIAHRLETVEEADQILVLEKGKLVGQGTHTELLRECKAYACLVGELRRTEP